MPENPWCPRAPHEGIKRFLFSFHTGMSRSRRFCRQHLDKAYQDDIEQGTNAHIVFEAIHKIGSTPLHVMARTPRGGYDDMKFGTHAHRI